MAYDVVVSYYFGGSYSLRASLCRGAHTALGALIVCGGRRGVLVVGAFAHSQSALLDHGMMAGGVYLRLPCVQVGSMLALAGWVGAPQFISVTAPKVNWAGLLGTWFYYEPRGGLGKDACLHYFLYLAGKYIN